MSAPSRSLPDVDQFARRYVAVWNEPDPETRRREIAALWAPDATEYVEAARFDGHDGLFDRVTDAHEHLVRDGGMIFRYAGDAVGHHGGVRLTVVMQPAAGGDVVWTGAVVATLDAEGRIVVEHQYADPPRTDVEAGSALDTRAVASEYVRRRGTGDPDEVAALFADQVDWTVSWPQPLDVDVPWLGPWTTRDEIAEGFRVFSRQVVADAGSVEIDDIVHDGGTAVLFGTSRQVVARTGTSFSMRFALRLVVENGEITGHHMYEDSLAVARACG